MAGETPGPIFPGINAKTTEDLAAITDKDIQHLPAEILEPIILQAALANGRKWDERDMKESLEMIKRGHISAVPGMPRRGPPVTEQDIDDLFGQH
jgi:hypothetical protein